MSLTFRINAFLFFILPLSASAIKKKGTNREKEESLRSSDFDTSLREGAPATPLMPGEQEVTLTVSVVYYYMS
jgi:hypothetical protein